MTKNDKNLDRILNQTLKYAKKIAKEFYFQEWGENPPKCPAFDGEVINITREGWEHIIDDTARTKTDVLGRLFVLVGNKKNSAVSRLRAFSLLSQTPGSGFDE